ncbi:MAG: hypothetical protein R6W90_10610 [Ignavibacteriaceae bacterium]
MNKTKTDTKMYSSFNHKKIITALFTIAVVFLIANITATKIKHNDAVYISSEASGQQINNYFVISIRSFGIDTNWIKLKKTAKDVPDSLYASYLIDVPRDLPIALLLKELHNTYDTNAVKLTALEKKIGGRTVLEISSGDQLKLRADFNYKDGIKRKAGQVGFILENFDDLNKQEDSVLLNSPETFAVLLVPSKKAAGLAKNISNSRKEYIILLNDNITELTYKLNPDYSEARLKSSIRSILGDFASAVFIMIDDNSNLFSSPVYPLLKSEMEKRNIKLLTKSSFRISSGDGPESSLRNFLSNFKDGDTEAVIISAEDYRQINNVIISYRKIGYKFVNPSNVVM